MPKALNQSTDSICLSELRCASSSGLHQHTRNTMGTFLQHLCTGTTTSSRLSRCKLPLSAPLQPACTGSISAAAYALLESLFSPSHGSMQDIAAVLLPRLTHLMLGAVMPVGGKRSAAEAAAMRTAAVAFVQNAYR